MARTIMVTFDDLERAAKQIENLAGDYQTQYNALFSETEAMAATWQGKDNIAYISQIEGFKDDFKKMYDLMISYSDFLKQSANQYRKSQEHVTEQAKKLTQ